MKNYASLLIEQFNDYMPPEPGDMLKDLQARLAMIRQNIPPGSPVEQEFIAYVTRLGAKHDNSGGTVDDILKSVHPHVLQKIVMHFRHYQTATGGDITRGQNY